MSDKIAVKRQNSNIVKKTCKELGISQKKLATLMDVSAQTVSNWGRDYQNGTLEKTTELALEGLIFKQRLTIIQKNITTII